MSLIYTLFTNNLPKLRWSAFTGHLWVSTYKTPILGLTHQTECTESGFDISTTDGVNKLRYNLTLSILLYNYDTI